MFSKTVRHARQSQIVQSPLFQNYVFVELDVGKDRWRSINGTFGVSHLIVSGDIPRAVPAGVVEALITANEDGAFSAEPKLHVGQQVRVVCGPFSDFVGTLQQLNSGMRARVLLQMLGRSVSVALSPELLAAAA